MTAIICDKCGTVMDHWFTRKEGSEYRCSKCRAYKIISGIKLDPTLINEPVPLPNPITDPKAEQHECERKAGFAVNDSTFCFRSDTGYTRGDT